MQLIIPALIFAFVISATLGPNNFMLLAFGAQFGFKRTIPHMLGIADVNFYFPVGGFWRGAPTATI